MEGKKFQEFSEGLSLTFDEAGARRDVPVVLLHALGSNAGTWDSFAAGLAAEGRHVLALDPTSA